MRTYQLKAETLFHNINMVVVAKSMKKAEKVFSDYIEMLDLQVSGEAKYLLDSLEVSPIKAVPHVVSVSLAYGASE